MEGSVDEVLIANRWLKPLQGALTYEGETQYLYFKIPKQKLTAGGRYAHKERGAEANEKKPEDLRDLDLDRGKTCEEPEEEEEEDQGDEEDEPTQERVHIAQVHTSATRVSTQPRSKLGSSDRMIIEPHHQTTIFIKKGKQTNFFYNSQT